MVNKCHGWVGALVSLRFATLTAGCGGSDAGSPAASQVRTTATTLTASGDISDPYVVLGNGGKISYADGDGGTYYEEPTTGHQCTHQTSGAAEGTQVTITDASGTVVGIGTLGPGLLRPSAADTWDCASSFSVSGILAGKSFYGVKIGDHPPEASVRV
ncbi:hypothetical protein GCM10022223_66370 [Kineosporia mesophila]|uniref:Lipoprotein n=1 Tax=Kineosporia mesophila TaxID=566012 RepID=A0ABP7ARD9_9ACTN